MAKKELARRKVSSVHNVKTTIDGNTGEVLEQTVDTKHFHITVNTKEDFFMVFASSISALNGGLSSLDEKLLRWICMKCTYNQNRIGLQKNIKEQFCKEHEVKLQSVSNSIHNLKAKNIIVPEGSGNYIINPKFFWRGDSQTRGVQWELFMSISKGL